MTEDFKQALRAGNLKEAFLLAMSKAPELHITTWIASPQDNPDRPQGDKSLRTHINLIEGKIENQIGEQLLGDRNPQIQQFHHQQVIQGHQTIQKNLESLQKMFRLMAAFQQRQQSGNLPSSWIDVREADNNQLNGHNNINAISAAPRHEAIAGSVTSTELSGNKTEPQLPSFTREEDDDAVVNDLLSLADLDEEEETTDQEDWGDWLEENEEPINTQFVDPNSLNPHQGYSEDRQG